MWSLEAATELLLRAFGGRFSRVGYPWVCGTVEEGLWINWTMMADPHLGSYSRGERRLLMVAASLGGRSPVDLAEVMSGLDPDRVDLVLAAIAHAAGLQQMHPWPSGS